MNRSVWNVEMTTASESTAACTGAPCRAVGHHVGKSKSHHGGEPCGARLSHWIPVHHCQQRDVGWTCGGGRPCQLGWRAGIHHFTTIGSGAFLAGLARVIKDVPPWMMVDGAPAEVRGCNRVGMQRAQMSEEDIQAVLESYRMLYREPGGDQESTCRSCWSGSPAARPSKALWIPSAHVVRQERSSC